MFGFKSILVISDIHAPYHHPDTMDFLRAIKHKYRPDKIINIGDELDFHALSFHDSDPDLANASDELDSGRTLMAELARMFPKIDFLESNHGSMLYRKAKFHGIPVSLIKSYREAIEAPASWHWHRDLTLRMSDGNKVYFCHGKTSAHGRLSQTMGMSSVQGHYHEKFEIIYWANPNGLFFDFRVGCLADDDSLAMAYNNTNVKRPINGTGIIIDGHPRLLPMVLNKGGRWNRKIL